MLGISPTLGLSPQLNQFSSTPFLSLLYSKPFFCPRCDRCVERIKEWLRDSSGRPQVAMGTVFPCLVMQPAVNSVQSEAPTQVITQPSESIPSSLLTSSNLSFYPPPSSFSNLPPLLLVCILIDTSLYYYLTLHHSLLLLLSSFNYFHLYKSYEYCFLVQLNVIDFQ